MAYQIPLTIKEVLESIARQRYVLPAIQREFVWADEPSRMARLFDSVLRGYPIGTFLFWRVTPETSKQFHFYEVMVDWHERKHRHNDRLHIAEPRELVAILDGQQRLTTLNVGLYGTLARRAPRKRADAIDAYPPQRLYIDLRYVPQEDDDLQFGFSFLTEEQAASASERHHWYLVGDILDLPEPGEPIFHYVRNHDLMETRAFKALARLWKAVHEDGVVSYFEERDQSLSKVLDIFVRVNSGGIVLQKSDLLLSIATAQFEGRDAREEVHALVDDLNATHHGFRFTKDLVLKSGLVLTDIRDVGFKVENFTAENMKALDENWDAIDQALRIGVKLLASFGFSENSLPAASVLIPIADYIHQRALDESYVTSAHPDVRRDRTLVRHWTMRTIVKTGIWGSGLDSFLRVLHQVMKGTSGGFPFEELSAEMARRGKSLAFDDDLLDGLVDTPYKHKRTFALLSLLYPWIDTRNDFHVDHVFPRSLATPAKLRAHGVEPELIAEIRDKVERLPNLQLLAGPENIEKRAKMPADWLRAHHPNPEHRAAWLNAHDLGELPADITDFLPFYEARRHVLRERLKDMLGAGASEIGDVDRPRPLPAEEPIAPAPPRTRPKGASSRSVGSVSVADLLAAGVLEVGEELVGKYKGEETTVLVTEDGRLAAGEDLYDSPSQAARLTSGQAAVNGWVFWSNRRGRSLRELRAEVGTGGAN